MYVRWEEDVRRIPSNPSKEEKRDDKRQKKEQFGVDESSNNWIPRKSGPSDYVKNCPEYPLWIHQVEVVSVLKKMGNNMKWPPKKETGKWKDPNKWCDFNQDTWHTTPDCFGLNYEVNDLLKKGNLKDLLSKKAKAIWEKRKIDGEEVPPPKPIDTYNVIFGGLEISGHSHTVAKKHEKEATQLLQPHHNALVLTLQITNFNAKWISIDNSSSANVLFFTTYKGIGLDETLIPQQSTALVDFSGEVSHSLGEVTLLIFVEVINKHTKFPILDSPFAYNAILGRPWLHSIKVVPSTYHQVLRYHTKNGVKEIMGDQHSSRSCDRTTMKGRK
ncbi:uncharacterized protein LOC120007281 [Tripterygium wilfordii]|uniref:uncharacterized protein LOC120007281 n=1 Tax=Tripterygium wilfordii TaxID=458696 RepID=UPI0018F822A9|nr:uncharacterized protein LOC120007281 [Tripterygium wilfordii]